MLLLLLLLYVCVAVLNFDVVLCVYAAFQVAVRYAPISSVHAVILFLR